MLEYVLLMLGTPSPKKKRRKEKKKDKDQSIAIYKGNEYRVSFMCTHFQDYVTDSQAQRNTVPTQLSKPSVLMHGT